MLITAVAPGLDADVLLVEVVMPHVIELVLAPTAEKDAVELCREIVDMSAGELSGITTRGHKAL
jgi:hypothetical protein